MLFVVCGWVLFRADGFGPAALMLRQMFVPEAGLAWYHPFVPLVLAGTAAVHAVAASGRWEALFLPRRPRWYSPALLFCLLWLTVVFYPSGFNPFIYFQF
jgi:alginate O-acetyltransferase complex protein AlgI